MFKERNLKKVKHSKIYKEFLVLVGELVVEYSKAEMHSALLVNEITKSKKGFEVYSKHINAEKKISEYIKALKLCSHPSSMDSISILTELDECRKERNQIAHSLWMHYPRLSTENPFFGASYDRKIRQYSIKKFTIEEIRNTSNRIAKVSGDIAIEFGEVVVLKRKTI